MPLRSKVQRILVGTRRRPHHSHLAPRPFLHSDFAEAVCLLIALLASINAPVSWKKAQIGHSITWCGWTFDFNNETIHLARQKLEKLRAGSLLLQGRKLPRKKLEAALGLLMWATSTCQHIRPYLAPLYRDLRSAAGTLKLTHPQFWQHFLDSIDNSAKAIAQPPGLWWAIKARIIKAGGASISFKQDLPRAPHAHKGIWVRIADPLRSEVYLGKESKAAIKWLQQCFAHDRLRPLQQPPLLHCFAAADAMAHEHRVGTGGWIVNSQHCACTAESWIADQVHNFWPQGSPQQYIACWETLVSHDSKAFLGHQHLHSRALSKLSQTGGRMGCTAPH